MFPETLLASTLGIAPERVWLSQGDTFVGDQVTISTVVVNNSNAEFRGTVEFLDGKTSLGKREVDLSPGKSQIVDFPWNATYGQKTFSARIIDPILGTSSTKLGSSANSGSISQFVDLDTDGDRIGNQADPDDDNDGLSDVDEKKLGTNPLLADTDGDGINDKDDPHPLKPEIAKQSSSTTQVAQKVSPATSTVSLGFLPDIIEAPVERVVTESEKLRASQSSFADTLVSKAKGTIEGASTSTQVHSGALDPGWGMLAESIDKGTLMKTPWQYTKLFFVLCYQLVVGHSWLYYAVLILVLIGIIRVISSIFFG